VSDPVRLTPGSVFAGDYKVVRPLRTGGQGSIYVVEQLSTSKQRALKLMLPELVAQPASRKRFELEAKVAARIQSDHVVETIASGVDAASGTPWLVMELLEGQDLAAYTQQKKRLPPAEVLEIFSQLCHGLGEAHKHGVIHRDLKPENIFLANARRRGVPFMVKVLDFGIARILAEAQTVSGATTTGLGTPMWMAPEQTIPGGPVGPSTDVWPLGLLAFRLLTGYLFWKAPYDPGSSVMMLMAEAFMHPLPSASDRAEHYKCKDRIPLGFDAWFARCVARPMEQRYADATEAFTALEPILAAVGMEASLPQRPSTLGVTAVASTDGPAEAPGGGPGRLPFASTSGGEKPVEDDPIAHLPTAAGVGPQPTGPGRATWEGAPELAANEVRSAPISTPPATPNEPPTADQAPPVHTTAQPATRSRTRTVLLSATIAGVLVGLGIFALQGAGHHGKAAGTAVTASPPPGAGSSPPLPSPSLRPTADAPEAPAASATESPSAEPASSTADAPTSAPAVTHKKQKLCKQPGGKCLGNDDCCDQTCRAWICRANAALHDPYQSGGK
jgi:eukaryotic-like serine/threonine-protein kinase